MIIVAFFEPLKTSFERLNKLGGRRDTLLNLLVGHFADKVVQKVKSGSVFHGTGDSWDMKVSKGHLFASNLIENRTNFSHLPNVHPKPCEQRAFSKKLPSLKTEHASTSKNMRARANEYPLNFCEHFEQKPYLRALQNFSELFMTPNIHHYPPPLRSQLLSIMKTEAILSESLTKQKEVLD